MNLQRISMKLKHLMQTENVNGALKLLVNNMSNGILPLTDKTSRNEKRSGGSSTARTNKTSSSCRLRSY